MEKKCIVMFSGGLDSRLALKIMIEEGFEVVPVFFRLPFGCGCCSEMGCSFNFAQVEGLKLEVFDATKGDLFQEYMQTIKEGKYGRGAGINPCRDCKIFMFKRAADFAKERGIDLVVTGDVLGERPMSQMKPSMDLIEEQSGLKGKLLRPLSAKLLPETDAEKSGLVNRENMHDIHGRRREKQIALADRFKIKYPNSGGGCLLCEKLLIKRFEFLINRGLKEEEAMLVNIGRHFVVDNCWVVLGKNENQNNVLRGFKVGEIIKAEDVNFIGPDALILDEHSEETKEKVVEIMRAYSKEGSLEERAKFNAIKI